MAKLTEAQPFELDGRKVYPDIAGDRLMRMLMQADLANVARLHSAGMKAGFLVNGRHEIHPIGFPLEVAGVYPQFTEDASHDQ